MSIRDQLEANLRDRVARNLEQTRVALVELIKAPINAISGQLAAGIYVDAWSNMGDSYSSTARSRAPESHYVDKGTGVWGPNGGRIYSHTPGKPLTFFWYSRGATYSFMSVRGIQPQNFFSTPMPDNFAKALQIGWVA